VNTKKPIRISLRTAGNEHLTFKGVFKVEKKDEGGEFENGPQSDLKINEN